MSILSMQETKGLISIVIATYNAERYLLKCLESIRSQRFKNIEIIVIDGGSKDATISILKSFNHSSLLFISEPDLGIYDALNKGVKRAKGDWLYFLGSDDFLLEGFSDFAEKLKNSKAIYYGNSESHYSGTVKPTYEILKGRFTSYRLTKYCMNHQSIIYPSSIFKYYHYDLRYKVFADYALNLVLWGDRSYKKIHLPIFIVDYNMDGFSSITSDERFLRDKPKIIRKHMGLLIYLRYMFRRYKRRRRGYIDYG
ncbi:glycosyltransferase family 2 protein [Olivibacter domesticus]|uniref:glycosyltransferase family 2 protein n=1 Tax=Olivibacter domesticus TaxID=407022 RepID=UPI003609A98A